MAAVYIVPYSSKIGILQAMPLTLIISLYQQLPLNFGTNVACSVGTQLCSSLVMIDFLRVLSSQISLAKAARITVLERRKYGRST